METLRADAKAAPTLSPELQTARHKAPESKAAPQWTVISVIFGRMAVRLQFWWQGFLTGFCLAVGLAGCRPAEQLPVSEYNDRIVVELDRASRRMAAFYAGPDLDTAQISSLQTYLLSARGRIETMEPYDGDDAFRNQALEVLAFYDRLCREQSRSLISLTGDDYYTIEDSLLVRRIVASILVEENRNNARFHEAQKTFASKHGLVLVTE